jgi:hypothetical protein
MWSSPNSYSQATTPLPCIREEPVHVCCLDADYCVDFFSFLKSLEGNAVIVPGHNLIWRTSHGAIGRCAVVLCIWELHGSKLGHIKWPDLRFSLFSSGCNPNIRVVHTSRPRFTEFQILIAVIVIVRALSNINSKITTNTNKSYPCACSVCLYIYCGVSDSR